MPRGGPRQGTPGASYGNRTDLNQNRQPAKAATGQPYGQHKAQIDAQKAIPLPNEAAGRVVPLSEPTTRPDEPVTAGLPLGPGPGPEVLGMEHPEGDIRGELGAIYRTAPSEGVRLLIELYDRGLA